MQLALDNFRNAIDSKVQRNLINWSRKLCYYFLGLNNRQSTHPRWYSLL